MIPGELVADAFALAWDIRILDMRAAPYDFTGVTLDPNGEPWSPVSIETAEGKATYAAAQRGFAERGAPIRERLVAEIATIRVGDVAEFGNFMGAVIDEKAWRKHTAAIEEARAHCEIVAGGTTRSDTGYFVDPTLVLTKDFDSRHPVSGPR